MNSKFGRILAAHCLIAAVLAPALGRSEDCAHSPNPLSRDGFDRFRAMQLTSAICLYHADLPCPGSSKKRLSAQKRVAADLMQLELARMQTQKGATRVAVVDSGFDKQGNLSRISSYSFSMRKGVEEASGPEQDEKGHGTAVAGLIGGEKGIGVAPQARLSVYRYSTNGIAKQSVPSMLRSIEKACLEGNEIINVSGGQVLVGDLDLPLFSPEANANDRKMLERLTERGCLIVAAAGNHGAIPSNKDPENFSDNPDDALLRVAAADREGHLTVNSTVGEILAPGEDVFTLSARSFDEALASAPDAAIPRCKGAAGIFMEGSSFAAPLVSGITASVADVLKLTPKYGGLSGADRIRLMNRILLASRVDGLVNGLHAVLIAERWAKSPDSSIPGYIDLARTLNHPQQPFCAQPGAVCDAVENCDEALRCDQLKRKRESVCSR